MAHQMEKNARAIPFKMQIFNSIRPPKKSVEKTRFKLIVKQSVSKLNLFNVVKIEKYTIISGIFW